MRIWKMMFSLAALVCMPAFAQTADAGLYVPTPQSIVDAMLDMGGVKGGDHVLDLATGKRTLSSRTRLQCAPESMLSHSPPMAR